MDAVIVYVVSGDVAAGAVTPVDTRTHIAGPPIVIGGGAQSILVTPNGKTVYVPNGLLNTVTPIRTATNTARPPIPVGGGPFALVVTPDGRTVYVGIRDFMGPTENYWDAAGPDGIPGFGDLDPGLDVKRMVSELFGETAPGSGQAESHVPPNAPERSVEISDERDDCSSEGYDDRDKAVTSEAQQTVPHRTENAATQKQSTQSQPIQKISRRHGGAMPE